MLRIVKKQRMKSYSFYNLILFRIQIAGCFLLVSFTAFSQQTLRTNLFVVGSNGSKTLMDGNMTIYDDIYCNCVNWEDALKMTNPGENWGLVRSGTTLAVERRKFIPEKDTTYIRMWNLPQRNYAIQIIGGNLSKTDRIAYLKDNYNDASTTINLGDTTYINFSVNSNSGTSAQNRFSVIFEKIVQVPIPVSFTSLRLLRKEANVNVEFAVENEKRVSSYMMQHASDTTNFKDVKLVAPRNGSGSEFYKEDAGVFGRGDNFYRIKATSADGKLTYSSVAKLSTLETVKGMNVFPNPSASRQINIQTALAQEGKYEVRIIGINGIVYLLGTLQLTAAQSLHRITLPASTKPGLYRIQLISPNRTIIMKSVTIL